MSIYVKLVCEALTDAKLLAAGPGGFWIWARGLLYAKQHLTDGVVPTDAMPLVAFGIADVQTEVNKLVTLKLWEPCDGGHRVPERIWGKYQTMAADVKAISELRRESGKKGGRPTKKQNESNLVSEESNLQPEKSKSAPDAKPRLQTPDSRAQTTDSRPQSTDTNTGFAGNVSGDAPDDEPLLTGKKPRTKHAYSAAFERWYALYPVKVAKDDAATAFGRALKRISDTKSIDVAQALDWLCGVTESFAESPKAKGEYVPYPATWLNRGSFNDDPAHWNRDGRPSGKQHPPRVGAGQRHPDDT